MLSIQILISEQVLNVFDDDQIIKTYPVSTAAAGEGEMIGSGQTPRGLHIIRAKIGQNCPVNTVFSGRRPTGEIFTPALRSLQPQRDWILTRILWLSGLEVGINRLGSVDTMRRFIYLHGIPDDVPVGIPGSKGCIRMRNKDIIELFDCVPVFTRVYIQAA